MADAGVARDPGRLPWLEPYRAPPRKKSNRRAGIGTLVGVAGLCLVVALLGRDMILDGSGETGSAPETRIILPAPEELQPTIILPPLKKEAAPASAARGEQSRAEPARLVRPARRPAGDGQARAAATAEGEATAQDDAAVPVSEAAEAIAALPLPPDPPRPAVNPSARLVRGKTVQLGVYLTAQQAETAWQTAIRDYTFLVTMPKDIEPITIRQRRFYRLQLGTPSRKHARQLCSNLKSIGRACTVA